MAATIIFLTTTGAGAWTVPSDWNPANNSIECIGGGGSGAAVAAAGNGKATGGGGGAYAKINNLPLTPGASVNYSVGAPGAGVSTSTVPQALNGLAGSDTWFNATSFASASVGARGGTGGLGTNGTGTANGGAGGLASASIGTTKYDGGSSGSASGNPAWCCSGGGGAAGMYGAGLSSANATGGTSTAGGAGDNGSGGAGGALGYQSGGIGGNGAEWDASHGSGGGGGPGWNADSLAFGGSAGSYGAGSGAAVGVGVSALTSAGAQGIIVITYTPVTSINITPTGVAASPAVGSVVAKGGARQTPTGVAASPAVGSVSITMHLSVSITGIGASPAVGSPSATGGAKGQPTGVQANAAAGTGLIVAGALVTPTGAAANPAVGIISALLQLNVAPSGVAASPAAGSPIATGGARVTPEGVAALSLVGRIIVEGVFEADLLLDPAMAGQYLVEVRAYRPIGASSGIGAVSETPVGAMPPGAAATGGQIMLRYADIDWVGAPDDIDMPNIQYDGRVELPLQAVRLAPLYPEDSRRVQRQFGAIEIINSDGALDSIVRNMNIDGRSVRVLFGPYMGAYAEFSLIASMVAVGWTPGEDIVRLELRDLSNILSQPLQTSLYGGTGGADGTSDIAGKGKPMMFGECENVTPTALDPLHLIYQFHDGPAHSVDGVFDRGGALTLDTSVGTGGDVASYAALVSASVGASKYATCLAEGLFKLGSSPAGLITMNGKGDVVDGVYSEAIDVIALRIIKTRGGIDGESVDEASFTRIAALGGPINLYVSSNETPSGSDLVDRIMASVAGWWGSQRNGRIEAGRLVAPESAVVDYYLDQFDIVAIEPEANPTIRWRHRVTYGHNWTVQRGEDMDVSVTDARRQFLAESDRVVTASDASLLTTNLSAIDAPLVTTLLKDSGDASSLAEFLQGLFGIPREIYQIRLKRIGYLMRYGTVLNVTYPRFGFSAGKRVVVFGITEDAKTEEIVVRVWG